MRIYEIRIEHKNGEIELRRLGTYEKDFNERTLKVFRTFYVKGTIRSVDHIMDLDVVVGEAQ